MLAAKKRLAGVGSEVNLRNLLCAGQNLFVRITQWTVRINQIIPNLPKLMQVTMERVC